MADVRRTALALAWLLLAVALSGRAEAQDGDRRAPESYLENLPINGNDSVVEVLAKGGAATGTLGFYDFELFGFSIPEREEDGLGFPDLVLSLEVTNEEVGGNADLFCLPHIDRNGRAVAPWPLEFQWRANHTQGVDHIFISSNDSVYGEAVRNNFTREAGHTTTVSFVCSVWGQSIIPTDFRLELDVDYTQRSLVPLEVAAMRSIFDKCCAASECPRWFRLSEAVVGWNSSSELPVMDMCHLNVDGNLCDDSGRLLKLNLNGYDMECELPVDELRVMSRMQKLSMDNNRVKGDIGTVAEGLKQLEQLNRFSAIGNLFNGTLSNDSVCELVTEGSLEYINIDGSGVSGPLPGCFLGEDSTLTEIYLDDNNLGSTIPAFAADSKIQILSLSGNNLTGSIPQSMENLAVLQALNLANNGLTGTIPKDIGRSPYLLSVNAARNQLSGAVPESLLTNNRMRVIELDYNELSELPGVWNTENSAGSILGQIYISHNKFEGTIPAAVLTGNMTGLDLSFNKFSGELPVFDDMLRRAIFVDLNSNELEGTIPNAWENIGMITGEAIFDFSPRPVLRLENNQLSGDIPDVYLVEGDDSSVGTGILFNLTGNSFECVNPDAVDSLINIVIGYEICQEEPEPEQEIEPVASPEAPTTDTSEPIPGNAPENVTEEAPDTAAMEFPGAPEVTEVATDAPVVSADTTAMEFPEAPEVTQVATDAPVVGASNEAGEEQAGINVNISGESNDGGSSAASSVGIAVGVVAAGVVTIAVLIGLFVRRRRLQTRRAMIDGGADGEGGKAAVSQKFEKFTDGEHQSAQMFGGERSSAV